MALSEPDGKPLSYDDTQTYHTFKLTAESASLTTTVNVFYNSVASAVPKGWVVAMSPATLAPGQSTAMVVYTQPGTAFGNVTIVVSAVTSASVPLAVDPIVLTQSWIPQLVLNFSGSTCCPGAFDQIQESVQYNCFNCVNQESAFVALTMNTGCVNNTPYPSSATLTAGSTWRAIGGEPVADACDGSGPTSIGCTNNDGVETEQWQYVTCVILSNPGQTLVQAPFPVYCGLAQVGGTETLQW